MQKGQWMTKEKKSAVVLIAEDDLEMRSLLCDELYDLGVSIREAVDGDEALRSVLDDCPSLILTDLRMPAGGLDYIARLRTFAPGRANGADHLIWRSSDESRCLGHGCRGVFR